MGSISPIGAALGLRHAQQVGSVQLAVAAKLLDVAGGQSDAALRLIESASENLASAAADLTSALGQFVDFQA